MATPTSESPQSLADLVSYLFTRREAILGNWRNSCEQDPVLNKISTLTREEFDNLLPIVLNILEQRLLGQPEEADSAVAANNHGLHRWHKAHSLIETMQELDHLTKVLYHELQTFQTLFPQTHARLLLQVQEQITGLMSEATRGSVQKYDELQRFEAATRTATLQQALDQMEQLSQQRGELLRTSSHDLRGSFGIINSAAYLLKMDGVTETEREQYIEILNRNLGNVQLMLGSLIDLSRLESGAEVVQIERVDAAKLIREVVDSAQPMAGERGLSLQGDGPASIEVETDPVKLQRIIQNLLLNALKYTQSGFVSVSWMKEGDYRWLFSVQDSGPGLPSTLSGLFAEQLSPTVEPTSVLSPEESEPVSVYPTDKVPHIPEGDQLEALVNTSDRGEGVGLQIVKRLCDMLNANLDIESRPDRGTLVRVRMPIHHTD